MANSLKCNLCNNPATVHLTQIVNNKVHKLDLCEPCAQKKGVTDPNGFSLTDVLIGNSEPEEPKGVAKCGRCGFTQSDFRRLGRLGCPACYEIFQPLISPVLENMHRGTRHRGKVPTRAIERRSFQEQLAILEEEIQKAVKSERYEDAARIRDRMNDLKKSLRTEAEI